jgi:hypothetical protein
LYFENYERFTQEQGPFQPCPPIRSLQQQLQVVLQYLTVRDREGKAEGGEEKRNAKRERERGKRGGTGKRGE